MGWPIARSGPTGARTNSPGAVEAEVCELRRRHPGWGPQRLRHELERHGGRPLPSRTTSYRVLVPGRPTAPDPRRRRRAWRRWERERPMELWQLDLIEVPLADGTEVKVLTGSMTTRGTASARRSWYEPPAGRCAGGWRRRWAATVVPTEVLTDNARAVHRPVRQSPARGEVLFERILRENGITHRPGGVRAPVLSPGQANGVIHEAAAYRVVGWSKKRIRTCG
jgi:hypothetical protein